VLTGRVVSGRVWSVARPVRSIGDGLIDHVINRGRNRQRVLHKPEDVRAVLQALANLKARKPFELYGCRLLNNHFHLVLRPTGASISRIVQSLLVSHTPRYHKRYRSGGYHRHYRSGGYVWQGRVKSPVIQNDEHLLTVLRYIDASPLRAAIVTRASQYRWSRFGDHGLGEVDEGVDPLTTYDEIWLIRKFVSVHGLRRSRGRWPSRR